MKYLKKAVTFMLLISSLIAISCVSDKTLSMKKAVEARKSVREFPEDKPLFDSKIEMIQGWIKRVNEESGLNAEFITDGNIAINPEIYTRFVGPKSLIVMKGAASDENLEEKVGYFGEELVLKCVSKGFGTCWVGGSFDKSVIEVPEGEKLVCVIAVGNTKDEKNPPVETRDRKPVNERINANEEYPKWVYYGAEAVQAAPSTMNSQRPMINYNNGKTTMSVELPENDEMNALYLVDLGIAKKHFEIGAGCGTFDFGNGGVFNKIIY